MNNRVMFKQYIMSMLRQRGMDQKDLCPIINKSPSTVSRYISGRARIPDADLDKVMEHLKRDEI